ncbi:RING finger protein 141 isoform X1 [Hypanus sabinus]|uniref:RING finger protein 141 isoform X1 n=1 Tax=Hypanus sabinus TaxID=79690 RepID=UPI0028C3ED57|nr:RING finger protein 141 isoform X1 [Hypanus sabinus]
MGQHISNQGPTVLNKLPDRVMKHASLMRESGFLTYEEFLARVAELNEIFKITKKEKSLKQKFRHPACTEKLAAGQEKYLLFEVQPGSDTSALWKVIVRIVSSKINKTTGIIEASRILNLYQFTQLYREISMQAGSVFGQSSISEDMATDGSSCQASIWLGRIKEMTDEEECCICMDGRADLILPCTHSFCQKCIDKWSDHNRNCPICRLQVKEAGDSWVVSDAPTEEDVASYILKIADEAGHPHKP